MRDEWTYTAVYGVVIAALLVEVTLALFRGQLGVWAPAGILALAGVQGLSVFLAFMHGRYGPAAVGVFMLLSLLTVVPLFVALLYSVASPPHAGPP